jgi:hypothetical protein
VLCALALHRLAFLTHAIAEGIGIGGSSQAAASLFEDGDAGLVVLNGEAALLGEDLLALFWGEALGPLLAGPRAARGAAGLGCRLV